MIEKIQILPIPNVSTTFAWLILLFFQNLIPLVVFSNTLVFSLPPLALVRCTVIVFFSRFLPSTCDLILHHFSFRAARYDYIVLFDGYCHLMDMASELLQTEW